MTETDALVALLRRGRNRRDGDRGMVEQLGFLAGVWNGGFDQPAGLTMTCGCSSPWVSNAVSIDLPASDDDNSSLFELETAKGLARVMIDAWDPDWATFGTNTHRRAQRPQPRQPIVGWLTYLSGNRPVPEVLPEGVTTEPLLGKGSLLILAPSLDEATPELARETAELLSSTGALEPTP